jgi:hypothetical protein
VIEAGLQQQLAADDGVSAIAADRIFPVILPETMLNPDATVPAAMTYQVLTKVPTYTLSDGVVLIIARVQLNCWASTYASAKSLMAAIDAALDQYTGTLPDGTEVTNAWRENGSRDDYDHASRLYLVSADYFVMYAETA